MAYGIVRNLDELGRITLPIEVRRSLKISGGDRVGLRLDGQVIRISKTITGMSRPLDQLGRIAVPIEYRRSLGMQEKAPVDMYIEDGEICLAKVGCEWCDETEDLFEISGHKLCRKCVYLIADAAMEG